MYKPEPILENAQNSLGFRDTKWSLNTKQKINLMIINKKNRSCRVVDFAVPADHGIKIQESKKRDMYSDLAWESYRKWE